MESNQRSSFPLSVDLDFLIGQGRPSSVFGVAKVPDARSVAPERCQRGHAGWLQHLHGAIVARLDVGRLQIVVDDTVLVRRVEGVGDLRRDEKGFTDRHRFAGTALAHGIVRVDGSSTSRTQGADSQSNSWSRPGPNASTARSVEAAASSSASTSTPWHLDENGVRSIEPLVSMYTTPW